MNTYYRNFYRDIYRNTNGFLPYWPFGKSDFQLGDMILIQSGKMIKLGNIEDYNFGFHHKMRLSPVFRLDPYLWQIQSGHHLSAVSEQLFLEGEESLHPTVFPGVSLSFEFPGSYFFWAKEISYQSIENFYSFQFELLQELTSVRFNFKELYIISTVAEVETYAFGLSNSQEGLAKINVPGLVNLPSSLDMLVLEDLNWQLSHLQGLERLHVSEIGGKMFFKAYKLEVSHRGRDIVLHHMRENLPEKVYREYASNIMTYAPTEILPSIEIYPAKVHELFHFREVSLDDVATFFGE